MLSPVEVVLYPGIKKGVKVVGSPWFGGATALVVSQESLPVVLMHAWAQTDNQRAGWGWANLGAGAGHTKGLRMGRRAYAPTPASDRPKVDGNGATQRNGEWVFTTTGSLPQRRQPPAS